MVTKNRVSQPITIRVPNVIIEAVKESQLKGGPSPAAVFRADIEKAHGYSRLSKREEYERRYRR